MKLCWHIVLSDIPVHLYVYPVIDGRVGIGTDIAKSYINQWAKERRQEGDIVIPLILDGVQYA